MDTCDRYELHENYKNQLKYMMKRFCRDFVLDMIFKAVDRGDVISVEEFEIFTDDWVDRHTKPAIFEEET